MRNVLVIIDMSMLSQTLIFLFIFLESTSLCSSVLKKFWPICALTNVFSQSILVTLNSFLAVVIVILILITQTSKDFLF